MEPDRWLGVELRHLAALQAIAQEGSFGRAALRLGYTQSAVSQQIATLEREVGMTLGERTREGTKATDAGRVLVEHADAAIARLDEAERELAAIAGLEGGEVRIASFPSASGRKPNGSRTPMISRSLIMTSEKAP